MLSPYIAHPCAAALAPACPGDRAGAVGIGWTVLIPSGAVPRVAESRIRAAKVLCFQICLPVPDLDSDRCSRIRDVHHAVINNRLSLLAPIIIQAEAPDRHQPPDALLVDLVKRTVAMLVISHAVGKDIFSDHHCRGAWVRRASAPRQGRKREKERRRSLQ